MKSIRRTFALFLALVLLCGIAPMSPPAHAASTVSFSMQGFYDYVQAAKLYDAINNGRQSASLQTMDVDGVLTESAMKRAVEIYACATTDRPDGSTWKGVLKSPFSLYETVQYFTIADTFEEAYNNLFGSTPLKDSKYKTLGVGCFGQNGGSRAWVVFASTAEAESSVISNGTIATEVTVNIKPSNLNGVLQHHYFSNAHCACYLIKGTTIGTALELRNIGKSNLIIVPSKINYAYTTTDSSVISFDNDAHTITALGVGKAELGITVDGQPINFISTQSTVEVYDTPVLTYEKSDGKISVYYGDFPVSAVNDIVLYIKGTKDELWTKGNIEADQTYEHRNYDPTETYTYVVRYYDKYLSGWVVIGEPLVVQLGDTPAVTPTPTPTPTPPTEDTFWMPTEADLPNRTSEPTVEEVKAELDRIFTEVYPWGFEWHDPTMSYWKKPVYNWHGGAGIGQGKGDAAFAMVVSDLVFGKLPAKVDADMSASDLRPGDIIVTKMNDWHIVLDAAPQYAITVSTAQLFSSGIQEDVVKSILHPFYEIDTDINYVLTRYTSDSPGVDVLHPSIVPADAEVIDTQEIDSLSNYRYTYALNWTLTADGTLYVEGYGSVGYKGDTWKSHKDSIKRIVTGGECTGFSVNDTFAGYKALEEVILGDAVTSLARGTFESCSNLKLVTFGKNLTAIGENAFLHSGLESLVLPDSLESIGSGAFSNCKSLKSLTVPASVIEWDSNAFTSCTALEELILEDGLSTLGYAAFSYLENLKTVNIPGSIKTIPKSAFYFSDIETLNIAAGVEVIDEDAFAYCKKLKEVHIPNTVTTIGDGAFLDCEALADVYFYGTEAQWNKIQIGISNGSLTGEDWFGFWFGPVIHFMDTTPCFHTKTTVLPAVAATCDTTGLTEGLVCADCGKELTAQAAVPALGHDYERTVVTEPTCGDAGEAEYICTNDPGHRYTEAIPATGRHGYIDGICAVCGKEKPAVIVNPFTDVKETDWYFSPVMWAVNAGVTGGKTATTFAPGEFCTRAQVVTFLYAAAGKPAVTAENNPFTDVKETDWFYAPVMWAVENGITGGKTATTFAPNETCTRAQVVTFLYAYAGKPAQTAADSAFKDVNSGDWYLAPVLWAVEKGVTGGTSPNTFGPNDNCTRAQVVTFLYANAGKPAIK